MLFLLLCPFVAKAQGLYPTTRVFAQPDDKGDPRNNLALTTTPEGLLLLGNRDGVYLLEGNQWQKLAAVPEVSALAADSAGRIYVGSRGRIGVLLMAPNGQYRLKPIVPKLAKANDAFGTIDRILLHRGLVYFYSREYILVYSLPSNRISALAYPGRKLAGLVSTAAKVFVNVEGIGLHEVMEGKLSPARNARATVGLDIRFCLPFNRWNVLIGAVDAEGKHRLFTTNTEQIAPFAPGINAYLDGREIYDAAWAGDNRLAIATVRRGVLMLDTHTQKLSAILDSSTALRGEAVYAVAASPAGGDLWLSTDRGVVLVGNSLPVQDYGFLSGISGGVLALRQYAGRLYVGTSQGLFYTSVSGLSSGMGLGEGGVPLQSATPAPGALEQEIAQRLLKQQAARVISGRKKGRRGKVSEPQPQSDATPLADPLQRLLSSGASVVSFRRVAGIPAPVRQLLEHNGDLYAASYSGVYLIRQNKALLLGVGGRDVRRIAVSALFPGRLYVLTGREVRVLRPSAEGVSAEEIVLKGLTEEYNSIEELPDGRLLLGYDRGAQVALFPSRAFTSSPQIERLEGGPANTDAQLTCFRAFGQHLFRSAQGVFALNAQGRLQPDTLLSRLIGQGDLVLAPQSASALWVANRDTLVVIRKAAQGYTADTSGILGLFQRRADALLPISDNQAWVATEGRLLRIQLGREPIGNLHVAFRQIRLRDKEGASIDPFPSTEEGPLLDYERNAADVSYLAAAYYRPEAIRYSHRLLRDGQPRTNWSDWSTAGTASFSGLGIGTFELQVRAVDYLGRISPITSYRFSVRAPWYYTWPAFLLYALLLGGGVYGFLRYRTYKIVQDSVEKDRIIKNATRDLQLNAEALESKNRELELSQHQLEARNRELATTLEDNQRQRLVLESKNLELADSLATIHRQQEQLVQSEKMAALGLLVANVAHEVNSPLGAIKGTAQTLSQSLPETLRSLPGLLRQLEEPVVQAFSELLAVAALATETLGTREERQLRDQLSAVLAQFQVDDPDRLAITLLKLGVQAQPERFLPLLTHSRSDEILAAALRLGNLERNVGKILQSVDKTQRIVTSLKTYARSGQGQEVVLEPFDLADNIDLVLTLYSHTLKDGIELVRDFQPLPPLQGFPQRLMQVWTNLLVNAVHAIGQKRKDDPSFQPVLRIALRLVGQQVEVLFSDNGPGIPADYLSRVFDQFFTTKAAGEGTGLGLYISRQIVEEHGGRLSVFSQPGETVFTILLPVAGPAAPPADPVSVLSPFPQFPQS